MAYVTTERVSTKDAAASRGALPFLTLLATSAGYATKNKQRHKTLIDRTRQGLLQVARWLPDRKIIAVGDAAFAAIALLDAIRRRVCMVTRLRLDARLFDPPPARRPNAMP